MYSDSQFSIDDDGIHCFIEEEEFDDSQVVFHCSINSTDETEENDFIDIFETFDF